MENNELWRNIEEKLIEDISCNISHPEGFHVNSTDENKTSLLHVCCQVGMEKLCKVLLEKDANVNATDIFGKTPLMIASYHGHLNIIRQLIENGACLEHVDAYGFTAVIYGVYSGNIEVMEFLNSHKGFVLESQKDTFLGEISPLAIASSIGNTGMAKYIISKEPEFVNTSVGKSGITPLMLAICGGFHDMVDTLLENNANIHNLSNCDMSCAHYAKELAFPLLKLNIPSIVSDCINDHISPRKRKKPPLTPNLYISPINKMASPKKYFDWIKTSIKPKRSRSLDRRSNEKKCDSEDESVLKSVFEIAKLEQYWTLFKEQEIGFKTFLTMDDEDLYGIGITKPSARLKLINLIDHYKKIFYSK